MLKDNGHPLVPWMARTAVGPTNGTSYNTSIWSRVAGLFDDSSDVLQVIHQLAQEGQDSKRLSLLAKGCFWEQFSSELRGMALIWIPNFGSLMLTGPLAWEIAAALRCFDSQNGSNPLETALAGIGVSRDRIVEYEAAVRADNYLLIVEGDTEQMRKAQTLMSEMALRTDLWIG